jgi:hypothetical protein
LAYVLVYELLIGKGCRAPVAAPEKYVLSRKSQLKSALAKRMAAAKVSVRFPRRGRPCDPGVASAAGRSQWLLHSSSAWVTNQRREMANGGLWLGVGIATR